MSALSSRRRWLESGPGLNERANERAREWESEKEKIGGGNRSQRGTSPADAHWCRDRPHPPWPEHTLLPPTEGREVEEERQNQELGSEVRGRRDGSLSFLSVAWDDEKIKQLSGPENETQRRLNTWPADWRRDRQEVETHHLPLR